MLHVLVTLVIISFQNKSLRIMTVQDLKYSQKKFNTTRMVSNFQINPQMFLTFAVCTFAIVNKLKAPLKDVIASNQYAYRPKVGSTDALLQLLDDCTAELDLIESKYVQLACLNFSKAFDKLQPQFY